MGNQSYTIKNHYLLSIFLTFFIIGSVLSQDNLTDSQITKGFIFLKEKGGFRNSSSVQYVSHSTSKHHYTLSCFTWAQYSVNAQNGFGGYVRGNYIVFFFNGQPILKMSDDHPYYSLPNSDFVASEVIALSRTFGSYNGDECPVNLELRKQQEKKNAEEVKTRDERTKVAINLALTNKEYFKAKDLFNNLIVKDIELENEINVKWFPIKKEIDELYSSYLNTCDIARSEAYRDYFQNKVNYLKLHKSELTTTIIEWKGIEDIDKSISASSNQETKESREWVKKNRLIFYDYVNGKDFLAPISLMMNINYKNLFINSSDIEISLNIDTNTFMHVAHVTFYNKNNLDLGYIINPYKFEVPTMSIPFDSKLSDLLGKIKDEGGETFVLNKYLKKQITFEYMKKIPNELKEISDPGAGQQNDVYNEVKDTYLKGEKSMKNFYSDEVYSQFRVNPLLGYFVKQWFPDAQYFVISTKKSTSQNKISIGGGSLYVYPILKGKQELINGNVLKIVHQSGNYQEISINYLYNASTIMADTNVSYKRDDNDVHHNYEHLISDIKEIKFGLTTGNISRFGCLPIKYFMSNNLIVPIFGIYTSKNMFEDDRITINNLVVIRSYSLPPSPGLSKWMNMERKCTRLYMHYRSAFMDALSESNLDKRKKLLQKANVSIQKMKTLHTKWNWESKWEF